HPVDLEPPGPGDGARRGVGRLESHAHVREGQALGGGRARVRLWAGQPWISLIVVLASERQQVGLRDRMAIALMGRDAPVLLPGLRTPKPGHRLPPWPR